MTKRVKNVPVPTKEQVLEFIRNSPGRVGKRELARAFNLSGQDKILIKALLKDLEKGGEIERGHKRRFARPGALPDYSVIEITGTDTDGELQGRPLGWDAEGRPPRIVMAPERRGAPALGVGDRVLAKLRRLRDDLYEGVLVRRVSEAPAKLLGVYETGPDGGRLRPTDRRQKADYIVAPGETMDALHGELVMAEPLPGRIYGLRTVKIVERLGSMGNPKAISLVCIHANDIPFEFSDESIAQAETSEAAPMDHRDDLRSIPLVTIDGEDARDFDDAVWAEADADPANPGGWHLMVAIADVSWYVRPGDALDRDGFDRGNSVYFPDRVVPMLPEALSNGWCSLKPDEDRPCMAVHIWIDAKGRKLRHRFVRGMMRSAARLTYTQVQNARDGMPDELTGPLAEPIIAPLYGAWQALFKAREMRGVLELDLPERKVVIDEAGRVAKVEPRPRYDAHRLIEDFMIAANVCAAETLEEADQPCMYRVHDRPSEEKLEGLREFLKSVEITLATGASLTPQMFNQILAKAAETPHAHLVNEVVLRSQAQAVYSPENLGHFGLGLKRYAHFTSPIRRYADLLVHRALIAGLHFGAGGLSPDAGAKFVEIGEHISATERRAASAEREAINRYTAAFLADRVGATFSSRITGVTRFGLFVSLDETGADGLVPVSTLADDYYVHDEVHHCLIGQRTRRVYRLGDVAEVLLSEANPLTGSMVFHMTDGSAKQPRQGKARLVKPLRKGRKIRR